MAYRFPTINGLMAMLIVSLAVVFFSMFGIYALLLQMEFQRSLSFAIDEKLEFEEDDTNSSEAKKSKGKEGEGDKQKKSEEFNNRYRVPKSRRLALAAIVCLITLLNYLMLVRNDAPAWLSWIGMGAVTLVLLNSHMMDEFRRKRLDRLMGILSLILLIAMSLHWAVYAQRQVGHGQLHEGKARITGYVMDAYEQNQGKESVTRSDLVVAWGGSWGCPSSPNIYCEAEVRGALCETEEEYDRRLEDGEDEGQNDGNGGEGESGAGDEEGANAEDQADKQEDVNEQEAQEANQEEEDLEEQNQELEQENEYYQEEVEAYEEYAEDLEDELEDEEYEDYYYYFDDDYYADAYWDEMDWEIVWGGYTCGELFMDEFGFATEFDETTEPGDDGWPFINIYGNCRTCEAYLVDYFSTEHFNEVENYKKSARNYGLTTGLSLLITVLLALKQRLNPTADQEIELLSRHGTTGFA